MSSINFSFGLMTGTEIGTPVTTTTGEFSTTYSYSEKFNGKLMIGLKLGEKGDYLSLPSFSNSKEENWVKVRTDGKPLLIRDPIPFKTTDGWVGEKRETINSNLTNKISNSQLFGLFGQSDKKLYDVGIIQETRERTT